MSKEEIKEGMENVAGGTDATPVKNSGSGPKNIRYGAPFIRFPKRPYGRPCVGIPKKPFIEPSKQVEPTEQPAEPLVPAQPVNPENSENK